ncbi:MAG: hypothetical protein ACLFPL_02575 [Candidatus Nanoarchaeia archaeon]
MKNNAKEVFIRIQNIKEIIHTLKEIEKIQTNVNDLLPQIETLKVKEEEIMENWTSQLSEIEEDIYHITL